MWKLLLLLPVLLAGCTAQDAAGIKVDLSQLNWQTAAIIALALLVSPGKIAGSLTDALRKVPGAESLLRMLRLVSTTDASPGTLTPAETLEALVSIVNRLPASPLRDQLALLLVDAAKPVETVSNGK